ncbi:MAG: ABC-2 transporter permease [Sporolactobacillus sp.]
MIQLMHKDILIQRKAILIVPLLLGVFIFQAHGLTATASYNVINNLFLSITIGMTAYIMVLYTNYSTGNNGDEAQTQLLIGLPVSRRSIVLAKYVMIGVWWLVTMICYSTLAILINVLSHSSVFSNINYSILLSSLAFSYIFSSIFYPLNYLFGVRVAQLASMVVFFIFMFLTGPLGKLFDNPSWISQFIMSHLLISITLLALIVTACSLWLSLRVFQKKDW